MPYQENLKTRCPVNLPRLDGVTGADFDKTLRRYRTGYAACAARHNQLVTEIEKREDWNDENNFTDRKRY
ncbi:hypothetical protein C5471_05470 [Photorhabdus tasmaniensis]|uniref:Uncharacterized protein n=1 Tax=Photorhabdus tasmaniensis TaxID=1004159 RepID=A0ABX0GDN0_9GAMM|nr:hypothetical protein [Photorhabdus tasmaniensis]